ncbi:MAG: hypothetical protein M3460_16110 [Actinomycetota bacterium]|nr:hypothetical protein [Actinomycetota bacterium]
MLRRITVTVHDDRLPHIDELADRLRAAGMQVDQVLQPVGVITGSVPGPRRDIIETLAVIETLPGVVAVEDETAFQIPPPDAEVQ